MPDTSGSVAPSGDLPLHLVLLVGVGGLPAPEALAAARSVTPRVSVVFVTAWTDPAPLRQRWAEEATAGGEFLEAQDLRAAADACVALHARQPVHGVATYSELLLRPQAEIVDRLGLPGNSAAAVAVAQSKALQRAAFSAHGVPSPRFAVLQGEDDAGAAVEKVGLPAVFKPSLGAGSQGVHLVRTAAELADAWRSLRDASTPFIQEDGAFLLEEAMAVEGTGDSPYADYVSVESLLYDGRTHHLTVTDRLRLRHGYVEEGLVAPSRLDETLQASVRDCAEQAARAIGLRHGAVHTEIALTPDGPRAIEVNARAGGPVPNMLRAAADYDFAAEIARIALGLPPGPPPAFQGVAWFRFVPIPAGSWRIVSQRTVDEARERFPELTYLSLRFEPGREVSRRTTQHLASFTVRGATRDQARASAEAVEDFLAIELEPTDHGAPPSGQRAD